MSTPERLSLVAALTAAFTSNLLAETFVVPTIAYPTIAAAAEEAESGDEILLYSGRYTSQSGGAIATIPSGVRLAAFAGGPIVFDGEGQHRGIHVLDTGSGTVIENISFRYCTGPTEGFDGGGAIYATNAEVTISYCTFYGGWAREGAGIYGWRSDLNIDHCTFRNNVVSHSGGGARFFECTVHLTDCLFDDNTAELRHGGGLNHVTFDSSLGLEGSTFTNCDFTSNECGTETDDEYGYGGGMYLQTHAENTDSVLDNCSFRWNDTPQWGGGIYVSGSDPIFIDCDFDGNEALLGGGVCNKGYPDPSQPTFIDCVFEHNEAEEGGGMHTVRGGPTLDGCLFKYNSASELGGGLYNDDCSVDIKNSTIRNNNAAYGGGLYIVNDCCTKALIGCTVRNNDASVSGGGMYIRGVSPDLTDTIVCGNLTDQINGTFNDLGNNSIGFDCDDPSSPDLNGDGIVDGADLTIVLANWGSCQAGEHCQADVTGDFLVDGFDLTVVLGNWGS